jgi:thymidylate synthase (FAD)
MKQTHTATLVWATPNGDQIIGDLARVSNSKAKPGDDASKLIKYLIRNRHWSPFEMATMCVEIHTTRDIGRQILRHRSMSFQEFSGRYAEYETLESTLDIRMQDNANRQNSTVNTLDEEQTEWVLNHCDALASDALQLYQSMLDMGIAKEVARRVLPEGMVPTKMYMTGTVRSWIHYTHERTQLGVQLEHRLIAQQIAAVMLETFPDVSAAVDLCLVESSSL